MDMGIKENRGWAGRKEHDHEYNSNAGNYLSAYIKTVIVVQKW